METAQRLEFDLTPRQSEAYRILVSLENADLTYGGAKGGGKSFLMCVWAYCWSKFLIDLFKLQPSEFPIPVGFIGRKRAVDFNKTTFETWKKVIPHSLYKVRAGDKEIVIDDTVKILYGGLDDSDNINKFNSAELAFIGVDQAEETEQEDISVLMGSLRLRLNGVTPPYKSLFTANPRHCWLKNTYIRNPKPGTSFIRALPSDNPHLPDNYEATLRHAFGHNPALLAAYLHGEWDVFEGMFFEEFNRNHHTYASPSVRLGPTWPRFISVDWGYASPMAVYWHAVGPDRHVYTYREWYKTRTLDVEAAREVREITEKAGETIEYAVGDPQSFPMEIAHYSRKFGRTVSMKRAEVWSEEGLPLLMGDSSRIPGWSRMRDYLRGGEDCHWHISEDCPNLIDELTTAVHDKNRIEDISAKSVDHGLESCAIAGTCILTEHGEKPIEEIKVGDLVHTRKGLRKVLVSKATGEKETVGLSLIDGRFLIASTDHPVLCGETWKPISRLEKGEKVWITQISTAKRGRYGARQMAIFQKNTTSITLTGTQPTTTSPTLNSLNEASICQNMERSLITEHPNLWRTSQGLDRWQRLQGKIQKYWQKSVKAIKSLGQKSHITIRNAVFAAVNIRQNVLQYPSFALVGVSNEAQRNLEGIRSSESAIFAERSTSAANSTSQKPVPIVAAIVAGVVKGAKQRVYNLQVDDCPEYFANGVLVHNCRLFLMSRPPLLESETYRPITHLEAAEKQSERERELVGKPIGM